MENLKHNKILNIYSYTHYSISVISLSAQGQFCLITYLPTPFYHIILKQILESTSFHLYIFQHVSIEVLTKKYNNLIILNI